MNTTTKQTFFRRTGTDAINRVPSASTSILYILLTLILASGLLLAGCEGPSGSQGERGAQGEAGPVGPAGEDGSVMYAGEGAPAADIGQNGDYYLNQNTGELYGPKDADGWGEPIIVLMGEDGTDGQDGADGQDGQDSSQIHAGSGAPGGSLGSTGDYYLDQDSYELYGPKTGSGWGSPLNLKGADGNANVTRYIFPGDLGGFRTIYVEDVDSQLEMQESAWLIYVRIGSTYYQLPGYVIAPGFVSISEYVKYHYWDDSDSRVTFRIEVIDGSGEEYDGLEIIRIEASNTEDFTSVAGSTTSISIIPDHLDVSNYEEVAKYYGFGGVQ